MIISVIPFVGCFCRVETSQLICSKNHVTGFCTLGVSTERYFQRKLPLFLFHNIVARVLVCLYSLLLMLSGDAEINPGPLSSCNEYF